MVVSDNDVIVDYIACIIIVADVINNTIVSSVVAMVIAIVCLCLSTHCGVTYIVIFCLRIQPEKPQVENDCPESATALGDNLLFCFTCV